MSQKNPTASETVEYPLGDATASPIVPAAISGALLLAPSQGWISQLADLLPKGSLAMHGPTLDKATSIMGLPLVDAVSVLETSSTVLGGACLVPSVISLLLWLGRRGSSEKNLRRLRHALRMSYGSAISCLSAILSPLLIMAMTGELAQAMSAAQTASDMGGGPMGDISSMSPAINSLAVALWVFSAAASCSLSSVVGAFSLLVRPFQEDLPDDSCPFRSLSSPSDERVAKNPGFGDF